MANIAFQPRYPGGRTAGLFQSQKAADWRIYDTRKQEADDEAKRQAEYLRQQKELEKEILYNRAQLKAKEKELDQAAADARTLDGIQGIIATDLKNQEISGVKIPYAEGENRETVARELAKELVRMHKAAPAMKDIQTGIAGQQTMEATQPIVGAELDKAFTGAEADTAKNVFDKEYPGLSNPVLGNIMRVLATSEVKNTPEKQEMDAARLDNLNARTAKIQADLEDGDGSVSFLKDAPTPQKKGFNELYTPPKGSPKTQRDGTQMMEPPDEIDLTPGAGKSSQITPTGAGFNQSPVVVAPAEDRMNLEMLKELLKASRGNPFR